MNSVTTVSTLTLVSAGAVPIITGIVQAFKQAFLPSKLAPLVSVAVGLGLGAFTEFSIHPHDYVTGIVQGIVWGLAAGGLYSGTVAIATPNPSTVVGGQVIESPGLPKG